MDWVNCNLCCRQPGDEKGRTFMLSSCGHIFCDICFSKAKLREKCAACSVSCSFLQLTSKMKPEAEMFFQEGVSFFKKHFSQVLKVLEFQKEHRMRLVIFLRKVMSKYKQLEKKSQEMHQNMCHMEREIDRLKEVNRQNELSMAAQRNRGSLQDIFQKPLFSPSMRQSPQHFTPGNQIVSSTISPGRISLPNNSGHHLPRKSPNHENIIIPFQSHLVSSAKNSNFTGMQGSSPMNVMEKFGMEQRKFVQTGSVISPIHTTSTPLQFNMNTPGYNRPFFSQMRDLNLRH